MPTKSSKATAKRKTSTTKKAAPKAKARKRESIDTGSDKRFVRRDAGGKFKDVADVGKSLASDRRKRSKKTVPAGQGDRGDQKRRS